MAENRLSGESSTYLKGAAHQPVAWYPWGEDAFRRPSFRRVLLAMADAYRTNRADTLKEAEALHRALAEGRVSLVEEGAVNEAMLKESLDSLRGQFDPVNGGIAGQQKFPHPGTMEWVMARYHRTREEGLEKIFARTLSSMAKGGVYDQIGGGFHRYSTDARWIVPHFEKMLYDNAGLLANYAQAFQAAGHAYFAEVARDTAEFMAAVLYDHPRGGVYGSQDRGTTPREDGRHFTWAIDEARTALSDDEFAVLVEHYHLQGRGEMHTDPTRHVLYVDRDLDVVAALLRRDVAEIRRLLSSGREKLIAARAKRQAPYVDHACYTNWNGLAIAAFLDAFATLGEPRYRDLALHALDRFIEEG